MRGLQIRKINLVCNKHDIDLGVSNDLIGYGSQVFLVISTWKVASLISDKDKVNVFNTFSNQVLSNYISCSSASFAIKNFDCTAFFTFQFSQLVLNSFLNLFGIDIVLLANNNCDLISCLLHPTNHWQSLHGSFRTINTDSKPVDSFWAVLSGLRILNDKDWVLWFGWHVLDCAAHHGWIFFWTFSSVETNNSNLCFYLVANFG